MDYLKERLPLISEAGNKDIKKFKAKLIDTIYSHYDDVTTIDCIRKIQMEMDQSVLESSLEPITIIGHVAVFTILFVYIGVLLWFSSFRNIANFSILLVFCILFSLSTRYFHKKVTQQNHETFKQTMQDMKNMCDVLINMHRHT